MRRRIPDSRGAPRSGGRSRAGLGFDALQTRPGRIAQPVVGEARGEERCPDRGQREAGAHAAERVADAGAWSGWAWFGIFFVGGWIFQLVGHVFEGRKPALLDNLFQIFVAPIFLAAEVFFALGFRREVLRKIEASSRQTDSAK